MENKLLNGTEISEKILSGIKEQTSKLENKPNLVVISVGDNEQSKIYINRKQEVANEVGFIFTHLHFDEATEEKLFAKVQELSQNPDIHGVIVQLPLPNNIDPAIISQAIVPWKDVDGFHPLNKGLLSDGIEDIIPPTAKGVIQLLESKNINVSGMNVVVIGEGMVTGTPVAALLRNRKATVTTCNKETKDLKSITKQADLIVSATGVKHLITKDMIKEDVILINVGVTKDDGKLYGDIDFDETKELSSYITPIIGGTGPLTVANLMSNTMLCYNLMTKK